MYDGRIMKTPLALLLVTALPLAAQTEKPSATPAKTPAHTASHRAGSSTGGGCVKLPELSPKIPALPAGSPCPKALYTITTQPTIKLDYVSPLEGEDLKETLGIDASTFSLAYVDTKIGTGELATPHKWYSIHYTGYLVDGTKFDSSLDRGEPISIPYGQHRVIPGWDTGFDGMRVGGKRRLFIPYQLGYGNNPHQQIPAKSELIFDVELVAISDTQPKPKTPPTPPRPPAPATKPATPGAPGSPATPPAAPPPVTTPSTTPSTPPSTTPSSTTPSTTTPGAPAKPSTPATTPATPPASSTPPPTSKP
jgi:peptidylprolyl isomerase